MVHLRSRGGDAPEQGGPGTPPDVRRGGHRRGPGGPFHFLASPCVRASRVGGLFCIILHLHVKTGGLCLIC